MLFCLKIAALGCLVRTSTRQPDVVDRKNWNEPVGHYCVQIQDVVRGLLTYLRILDSENSYNSYKTDTLIIKTMLPTP